MKPDSSLRLHHVMGDNAPFGINFSAVLDGEDTVAPDTADITLNIKVGDSKISIAGVVVGAGSGDFTFETSPALDSLPVGDFRVDVDVSVDGVSSTWATGLLHHCEQV